MTAFTYFVLALIFLMVGYFLGNIVGYLNGKAEVSHIMRGEPPDIFGGIDKSKIDSDIQILQNMKVEVEKFHEINHELHACGLYDRKG